MSSKGEQAWFLYHIILLNITASEQQQKQQSKLTWEDFNLINLLSSVLAHVDVVTYNTRQALPPQGQLCPAGAGCRSRGWPCWCTWEFQWWRLSPWNWWHGTCRGQNPRHNNECNPGTQNQSHMWQHNERQPAWACRWWTILKRWIQRIILFRMSETLHI